MSFRTAVDYSTCHIINIDIQDNHEEATLGAFLIFKMAQSLANSKDLDNDIDEMLQDFETSISRPLLHTIAFQWQQFIDLYCDTTRTTQHWYILRVIITRPIKS